MVEDSELADPLHRLHDARRQARRSARDWTDRYLAFFLLAYVFGVMASHLLGPVPPAASGLSAPMAVAVLVGATGGAAVLGHRFGEGGLPLYIDLPTLYHPLRTGLSARRVLMPSFRRTLISAALAAALVGVLLARPAAQQLGFALLPAVVGSVLWVELWAVAFLATAGLFRLFQLSGHCEALDFETLERRARVLPLFGSAVVLNNARAFLLAYRWLSQETIRLRPWGRPPLERVFGPFWQRLWRGLLRMPGSRLRRLALCTIVAAGCHLLLWRGAVVAAFGAALCLLVIGVESVDALAHDDDAPSLSTGLPTSGGSRSLRYLLSGAMACMPLVVVVVALPVVGAVVGLIDVSVRTILIRSAQAMVTLPFSIVLAGRLASIKPQPLSRVSDSHLPNEVAAMRALVRLATPPAVAMSGLLPVLVAVPAARSLGTTPGGDYVVMIGLAIAGLAWLGTIRFRDEFYRVRMHLTRALTQPRSRQPREQRSEPPPLELDGAGKQFGEVEGLRAVDLVAQTGEFVALVGPNGSGKSTLLELAAGMIKPTQGTVSVFGAPPLSSPEIRSMVSYVPDQPVLYDDISVLEQLQFMNTAGSVTPALHASLPGMSVAEVTELLGLGQVVDRSPAHLSKGMRQRVSLAMGLTRPFRVLLADEPLGGLDRESEERVLSALKGLVSEGRTVLVATHEDDLIAASSRLVELRDGAIHSDGPT